VYVLIKKIPTNTKVHSLRARELIKEVKRLKEEIRYLKASSGDSRMKLITHGPTVFLNVVDRNSVFGYRITRILKVFNIPRSNYYDSPNWRPNNIESRWKALKGKIEC